MRLALVAVCLLVVVAVTISPSSGNPAPGIKDRFANAKEKIKGLVDKIKVNESFKNFWNRIKGGLRGRRDVDFKNNGTYYSELSEISDLVSALQAASDDILSSVEYGDFLKEGSFEDDMSDQDDSDEDEAGEDVDEGDVDDEKVEDSGEGGGENVDAEDVDNSDAESGSKENYESNENGDEEEVQEEA